MSLFVSERSSHLGEHFASKDPEHLRRWAEALAAGRAKLRCSAVARTTGKSCRAVPLKFADRCRCHLRGSKRAEVDALRLEWLQRRLPRTSNPALRQTIVSAIAGIERRRLQRAWRIDPTVEGSTIALEPRARARVLAWLSAIGRIEDFDGLTARAQDRLLWAGGLCLAKRTTEATALKSAATALKDEARWRTKMDLEVTLDP
jgi:hypothetical protein